MRTDFYPETSTIQAVMIADASSILTDEELGHLRTLIRLTVEFFHFLNDAESGAIEKDNLLYACDSIVAGVDSFHLVSSGYRVLEGHRSSSVAWGVASSMESLRREFNSIYHQFTTELALENKCRLLLDLFKLQIIFVGTLYP